MTQAQIDEAFDAWWISQHPHPPLPEQRDHVALAHAWFCLGATSSLSGDESGSWSATGESIGVIDHDDRAAYEAGHTFASRVATP